MTYTSHSPEETEQIGVLLAKKLTPGTVIAFEGDLGAGKTAFTRGLARGLEIPEGKFKEKHRNIPIWVNRAPKLPDEGEEYLIGKKW